MKTRKIKYDILNEIKELELGNMEHDYTRISSHERSHGTSRILKVMITSQMMLFDMVKIVMGNFMSLGIVSFPKSFINVDT